MELLIRDGVRVPDLLSLVTAVADGQASAGLASL